ncbi:CLUMA_CG003895, isoform A [Clunio marinus]|uniref:CLUMA_CG003895, isoform A n=1 Tax=Clunio marinus TaxID=568069 RepID=A0A1J1HQ61_9DIPT|nr:CLUMA_CG003895, isoform A [Clunio marinus]
MDLLACCKAMSFWQANDICPLLYKHDRKEVHQIRKYHAEILRHFLHLILQSLKQSLMAINLHNAIPGNT